MFPQPLHGVHGDGDVLLLRPSVGDEQQGGGGQDGEVVDPLMCRQVEDRTGELLDLLDLPREDRQVGVSGC